MGAQYVGAAHYFGLQLDGTLDFDKKGEWVGRLGYGHVNSDLAGASSTSNSVSLGATNFPDDFNEYRGSIDFWDDKVNQIHYAGPTVGYTHTWMKGDYEDWALSFDAGLYFYGADVEETRTTNRPVRRGTVSTTTTQTTTITTTQFHPTVFLEKAFLDEVLVPYVSGGHYFYSSDPATLEGSVNAPSVRLSSTGVTSLNALVGGFLENEWSVGLTWLTPVLSDSHLRVQLARTQSATDGSWASVYSVKLDHRFSSHFKGLVGWNHSSQLGEIVDYGIVGATYYF